MALPISSDRTSTSDGRGHLASARIAHPATPRALPKRGRHRRRSAAGGLSSGAATLWPQGRGASAVPVEARGAPGGCSTVAH